MQRGPPAQPLPAKETVQHGAGPTSHHLAWRPVASAIHDTLAMAMQSTEGCQILFEEAIWSLIPQSYSHQQN
eukprot:2308637-Pyramimonas_sp.AAC.1